jgi:3-oxoacyl-[acyl-carrier protein] reductase
MLDFSHRTALVTGCGSADGIGFACARLLARLGAALVITSTTERIHERAAELPGAAVTAVAADLTDGDAAARLVEAAGGHVDVLVHAAGMVQTGEPEGAGPLMGLSYADWRRALARNLDTAFHAVQAALPGMAARGYGRIVLVSSVTGPLVAIAGQAGYAAAKAGMDGLMRTVALEHGGDGITCNCVSPGWIATASSEPDELKAGRHTPVGRPGTPDEVAAAIAFLCSAEAGYVTGQPLVVDGGNVIQEHHG